MAALAGSFWTDPFETAPETDEEISPETARILAALEIAIPEVPAGMSVE